jgi:hypothetical protein
MKSIVTNLVNNLEETISNRFQLFNFCFKPLLADVKTHFITNFETVINTMLVMSRFVLGLTLFQLLLHHLMYRLNFFNELLYPINIIFPINNNIFPKDKI